MTCNLINKCESSRPPGAYRMRCTVLYSYPPPLLHVHLIHETSSAPGLRLSIIRLINSQRTYSVSLACSHRAALCVRRASTGHWLPAAAAAAAAGVPLGISRSGNITLQYNGLSRRAAADSEGWQAESSTSRVEYSNV